MLVAVLLAVAGGAHDAVAAERLCDSARENCRTPLINLIRNETQNIDVAFWLMEDTRYTTELIAARNRGVRVRVLVDTKANIPYPGNATVLARLRDGGIPMRRTVSRYLHWKFMLFGGQNVVQFGSANFTPHAFVPVEPNVNFIDEAIFLSDDPDVVNSFKTRFDDGWVSTNAFTNYANVTTLSRTYPTFPIDSELNFPPFQDFGSRSVGRYNAETTGIDVIMFRLGDRRHADAIIAARQRGIPVRLYTEQSQYRDPKRPLHSFDVDRLYRAGVQIRHRNHSGGNHLKLTLLRSQGMAVFGSQNWTHTGGQYEHNYFTRKSWIYQWFSDQFASKWSSSSQTKTFVPLAPTTPTTPSPGVGVQVSSSTTQVTLRWYGGLWAHKYDIHFGTSSNPPRIATDVQLGYSRSSTDYKSYTVTVARGQTYYWKIVSKTMANLTKTGPVWSFRTAS
jgi:hypothetical protein